MEQDGFLTDFRSDGVRGASDDGVGGQRVEHDCEPRESAAKWIGNVFALLSGEPASIEPAELAAVSAAIQGSAHPCVWHLELDGRAGAAAGSSGTLPEDAFDAQPLSDGDLLFVSQARIDNRTAVLDALGISRAQRCTLADSQVMLLAYRRWGEACMQRLSGDYAFAAWHRASGDVVAAVDHIGSVDLFYAQSGGTLIMSPQLGAVLKYRRVSATLDQRALGLLLTPKIEAGSTPFAQVRAMVGGHLLTRRQSVVECRRWWRPNVHTAPSFRDPRDYALHVSEVFDGAVASCLRATSGIAATVSGGLDSTLVAATAASQLKEGGRGLAGFTAVPEPGAVVTQQPGFDADDWPFALAVAALHDNLSLTAVSPGGRCTLDVLPDVFARSLRPVRNVSNVLWLESMCQIAAAAGQRVLLTGQRGNYGISAAGQGALRELLSRGRLLRAYRQVDAQARRRRSSRWRVLLSETLPPGAFALFRRLPPPHEVVLRPGADLLKKDFREHCQVALDEQATDASDRKGHLTFAVAPNKLWRVDSQAQWGVELRDPTANRDLLESLMSLPLEAFVLDGQSRGLARAMGRTRIPDVVRLRSRRGAQLPELPAVIASHAERYFAATAQVGECRPFTEIVDRDRLTRLCRRVCDGHGDLTDALTLDRALSVGLFLSARTG